MSNSKINLDNKEYMDYMLKYLQILMDGRHKPDSKGGFVRESVGEVDDIAAIKYKLANDIFNLKEVEYHSAQPYPEGYIRGKDKVRSNRNNSNSSRN